MMDRQAIQGLIEQVYEARDKGDIEAVMASFHIDGKFELAGSQALTRPLRISRGQQAVRTTLANLIATFQFVERKLIGIVIENEQAAVHCRVKLRFIPKDRTVTTDLVDLWKFNAGKVIEVVEFADTALVGDLMR
jgi:ketosteroid isomerase-like protein